MPTPDELAAEYVNRQASVEVGSTISRGMSLVTANLGLTVGATWIAIILAMCVHLVPLLGWLAGILLGPALFGGVQYTFIRRLRGEAVTAGDIFVAFNDSTTIIQTAIAGIVIAVFVSLGMMLLVLPGVYLAIGYTFTLPLILDKKLEFWPAMEVSRRVVHRHWFSVFFVILLSAIVAMLGLLAVLIGIIVTIPIAVAAPVVAYEDLFGAPPAAAAVA